MVAFRTGVVTEVLATRRGLQKVRVEVAGASSRAYVLTQLIGEVEVGDPVVCNTTAVDLDLGTGGWHFVHWNLARTEHHDPGPGHIMKLRFTSAQVDTGAAEEHHAALADASTVSGLTVVAASLHSQLPAIVIAARDHNPAARIAYVMTDGAALPLALSDLVAELRARDLLDCTITAGHAFGGDHEAVTVASALATARHVAGCDLAVVVMGPGIVGTGTTLGTTATEVATVLDTAAALGARPIAALRASTADPRERHRGLSHHSVTALATLAARRAAVAVPDDAPELETELRTTGVAARHDVRRVTVPDIVGRFDALGLHVTSMGRPALDESLLHRCGAAAGILGVSP